MSTKGGNNIVRDGLVLCLDAGSERSYPKSGTIWKDLSGNNNSGSLVNGPTFDSSGGNISFDGINDVCDIMYNRNYTNYSMIIWVRFTGLLDSSRSLIDEGSGGTPIRLYINSTQLKIQHTAGFADAGILSSETITTAVWQQWAVTHNNGQVYLYKNSNVSNQGILSIPEATRSAVALANRPTGNSSFILPLNCNISQTLIYNRALTPQEIQQNYNATKGRYGL
jgi:hypothetical protein